MAVVQRNDQLLEEPAGLILLKAIPLLDILKHVSSRGKLHCNSQKFIGQEHLLELNDMWMQQPIVIEQFPFNVFGDLQVKGDESGYC